MDNELQDLVAYLSAQGRAQSRPQQAYSSMSFEPEREALPMRGNSGAGWAGPGDVNPGTDWSPAAFRGAAPGYSPNRGVREWGPESDAAEDAAFNAQTEAWNTPEEAQRSLREGSGPANLRDWQKYQDLMAQPYQRPQPPPINKWQGAGQMQPTGDPGQYGMLEQVGKTVGGAMPPAIMAYLFRVLGQQR